MIAYCLTTLRPKVSILSSTSLSPICELFACPLSYHHRRRCRPVVDVKGGSGSSSGSRGGGGDGDGVVPLEQRVTSTLKGANGAEGEEEREFRRPERANERTNEILF